MEISNSIYTFWRKLWWLVFVLVHVAIMASSPLTKIVLVVTGASQMALERLVWIPTLIQKESLAFRVPFLVLVAVWCVSTCSTSPSTCLSNGRPLKLDYMKGSEPEWGGHSLPPYYWEPPTPTHSLSPCYGELWGLKSVPHIMFLDIQTQKI